MQYTQLIKVQVKRYLCILCVAQAPKQSGQRGFYNTYLYA